MVVLHVFEGKVLFCTIPSPSPSPSVHFSLWWRYSVPRVRVPLIHPMDIY